MTASTAKKIERQPGPHKFDQSILREYDIRGRIGETLSASDAFAIGLAFGTYVRRKGGKTAVVGYDGRESSIEFSNAVIDGLVLCGLAVENIGLGPTPMLSFAVKDRKADGGIMITGSHNPPEYNGFKMSLQSGPVYGDMVQEIGRIAASGNYELGDGSATAIDIVDTYVNRIFGDYNGKKDLRVVWDNGNGSGGEVVRRLTAKLPGEHFLLYDKIDGTFPNHHPDPTVDENLEDLIHAVREKKADLGVAFDGDADRVGAVDEKGNVLRCDTMITIYARDILKRHPGAPIIGDVKSSQVMFDEIERLGGKPVMWKTGHSLIKAKMAEMKAPLAGELSGHIFFGDGWYGFDDGIYCAVRLMNEVSNASGPASSLTAHLPKIYNTPEIRFEVDEARKFDMVAEVAKSVQAQKTADMTINDIDGVRVVTPYGWWLLRASNTQNVLVTRAEAQDREGLEKLKQMVVREVAKIGYDVKFPAA